MEGYRYYQCQLTPTCWKCQPTESTVSDTFLTVHEKKATILVPVPSWIPPFLDALVVSTKVPQGVLILSKNPLAVADLRITPYTRTSSAEGPKLTEAKSSE